MGLDGRLPLVTGPLGAQVSTGVVAGGRPEQAERLLKEVEGAVEQTRDGDARFTLDLAEAALQYVRGHFETALADLDAALRTGADVGGDPRQWVAPFRGGILAVMDRFDEALAEAAEGIRLAQQDRQGRALRGRPRPYRPAHRQPAAD
jgi:hypothetical protein